MSFHLPVSKLTINQQDQVVDLAYCLNPIVPRERKKLAEGARKPKSEKLSFIFLAAEVPVLAEVWIDLVLYDIPS